MYTCVCVCIKCITFAFFHLISVCVDLPYCLLKNFMSLCPYVFILGSNFGSEIAGRRVCIFKILIDFAKLPS